MSVATSSNGNATIEHFDEDHEPIGPMLRKELMPRLVEATSDGSLRLTIAGFALVTAEDERNLDQNWIPA